MNNISGPASAIIVALIFTSGMVISSGALTPSVKSYATVHYDGGYKKIGVISSEDVFTEASVEFNGEKLVSGDFAKVIAWIKKTTSEGNQGADNATWKSGVSLTAKAGIEWVGSESRFQLTTDTISIVSTDQNPILPSAVVNQLQSLEAKTKENRKANSKDSLEFSESPKESFILAKLLAALSK